MTFDIESEIRKWRDLLRTGTSLGAGDIEELESHLRDSVDDLSERGISREEAFLVSIRRLGATDTLADEFAKLSTERVWRQLLVPAESDAGRIRDRRELVVALALALLAVVLGRLPLVFGSQFPDDAAVYFSNLPFFAFVPVGGYLWWKRSLPTRYLWTTGSVVALFAVLINVYPDHPPHDTRTLTGIHLPIAIWLTVGVLYAGPGWRRQDHRLDFVRFSGEVFIYSVLIALGGGVLMALAIEMFGTGGLEIEEFVTEWVLPSGMWATPVVAAYLVERKMGRIESIAPVLARMFSPLFLLLLLSLLVAILVTGNLPGDNREALISFDILLAIVLGLVLYTMAARDSADPPGWWDGLMLALLAAALVVDVIALAGILDRLTTFGVSPNKTAALGENLVLLINLSLLAWGYGRFLARKQSYRTLVAVQMRYLPVYALWAAFVALVFPLIFGFR